LHVAILVERDRYRLLERQRFGVRRASVTSAATINIAFPSRVDFDFVIVCLLLW
jgi:hypothetical protein